MWRPCGFLQSATPATHLVETLPSLFRFQFPNGVNIFLGIMVRQVANLICIVTFTVHVVFPKGARQVRHYHAGVGGLSAARALRVGFDSRSFDPYVRGQGEYIMAEDLELDSIVNTEIESIKSGATC